MRAFIDCIHCYLKQAVNCMNVAGVDEESQYRITFHLMDYIRSMNHNRTPAENSTEVLLEVCRNINCTDPYKDLKKTSNNLAMEWYPRLKDYLNKSSDRLADALKISVSGNVIDLGINKVFDIDASLRASLSTSFARDDSAAFLGKLHTARNILIVGDNSGEIVFDKLLAEELSHLGKRVTFMVKGGPILNDALLEDALQVGMDRTAGLVTTGSNYLGAPLKQMSEEARKLLEQSDLVISKGQANFESLEQEELARGRVFFLLKIKCDSVGRVAAANFGDIVFFTR